MLKYDGKEYRNLQEQVQKNKDDISNLISAGNIAELGIKIVNAEAPLESAQQLPNASAYEGDYGDGYIVGTGAPFMLYVYSRSSDPSVKGYWFNWGELNAPSVVPGPIGPQGIQGERGPRGSFWYSQSGAPTNTEGVNENDQALDSASGDVYQYVGGSWQPTGNIRGPQGLQGLQGNVGAQGPQGEVGPIGPQGPQGEFIQIVGELTSSEQLPAVDSVPRSTAYLIPDTTGAQHVWLIIGRGIEESPYLWHDAGGFGGGSTVLIDGVPQSEVDVKSVYNGAPNYLSNAQSTVSYGAIKDYVQFNGLTTTGNNLAGDNATGSAYIRLPIKDSNDIQVDTVGNDGLRFKLTSNAWTEINASIGAAQPKEVQITAPSTSTHGSFTEQQMEDLQANKGTYLMFNNEVYRLNDSEFVTGYLIYSHIGFDYYRKFRIKCISVQISTRTWALSEREVLSQEQVCPPLYLHKVLFNSQTVMITSIDPDPYDKSQDIMNSSRRSRIMKLFLDSGVNVIELFQIAQAGFPLKLKGYYINYTSGGVNTVDMDTIQSDTVSLIELV